MNLSFKGIFPQLVAQGTVQPESTGMVYPDLTGQNSLLYGRLADIDSLFPVCRQFPAESSVKIFIRYDLPLPVLQVNLIFCSLVLIQIFFNGKYRKKLPIADQIEGQALPGSVISRTESSMLSYPIFPTP